MDKTPNRNIPRRLRIRMTVELGYRGLRGPMFYRWLPLGADNGIRLSRAGLVLLLWLDPKAAIWASEVTEETIPHHVNLTAHRIYADITTTIDDTVLLSYISSRVSSGPPSEEEELLLERYKPLVTEVFSLLRDGVNRLLTFIRVEKGQFWVDPLEIEMDNIPYYASQFEAKAQVDDGPWFRWKPPYAEPIVIETHPPHREFHRFLTQTDWPQAQAFVSAEGQPDLTRQLLVEAETFANAGNARVALTEAVTALEVAVSRFMGSPKPDYLVSEPLRSRLGLETLANVHQRRGLTYSVSFLLPILFDESTLSSQTLATCREALERRQNVVHRGARRTDLDKTWLFLDGIRELCKVLQDATAT